MQVAWKQITIGTFVYHLGGDVIAIEHPDRLHLFTKGDSSKEMLRAMTSVLRIVAFPCAISTVQGHWVILTDNGSFPFNFEFTLVKGVDYD